MVLDVSLNLVSGSEIGQKGRYPWVPRRERFGRRPEAERLEEGLSLRRHDPDQVPRVGCCGTPLSHDVNGSPNGCQYGLGACRRQKESDQRLRDPRKIEVPASRVTRPWGIRMPEVG